MAPLTAVRLSGLVLAALSATSACWAQGSASTRGKSEAEIAPFRLTGIDGYVQARYLTDGTSFSIQPGLPRSEARQSVMTEEVFILTHSYIYHPSLLSLDIGGGPVFDSTHDEAEGVKSSNRRRLYNFKAYATVLRDKPYSGVLFYDRANNTQSMGPALEMLTENTRAGFNVSLRSPVTRYPMKLEVTRTRNHGEGAEQLIDDRVNQARFTADAEVGRLGTSSFQYLATRQNSSSGSIALPIQSASFRDDAAQLDTRLKFGAARQYELTNTIALDRNRYQLGDGTSTHLNNTNVTFDLRGRHSDDLQTNARYNFNNLKQPDDSTTLHSASAGVTYRVTPQVSGSLDARGEVSRGTHLDYRLHALDGSALYQPVIPVGQASLGYTFSYNQRDQQATAVEARIIGERQTLTGVNFATLGKQQIVPASVVVSNLTRSQTYVQGVDYELTQIGLSVRIRRLVSGNLLDGQEVLLDYAYGLGGTYALSQLDQTVSASWAYQSYLNLFARYLQSTPHLESGTPTSPLNPVHSVLYGMRSDVPLPVVAQGFTLGGSAEQERRRETILPYQRASYEAYAQVDLPIIANGLFRLGARQMNVDYDNNPSQTVKLRGYDLRLWMQVGWGLDITIDATRERDTGTAVLRQRSLASAKAQWRRRKLSWSLGVTHTVDVQGPTERVRTYGQMALRRDL